jgi:hypothetical protein
LAGEARLTGAPAIEPGLDIGLGRGMPGGQPSTMQPMAGPGSAEGGDPEEMAELLCDMGRSVAVAGDRPISGAILHSHDVIPGVDMVNLTGHGAARSDRR